MTSPQPQEQPAAGQGMNPDDMTDEQVAAMITAVRAMLERLTASIAEGFAAWEQELATQGWADR